MFVFMRLFRTLRIVLIPWIFVCSVQAQTDFSASDTSGCTIFHVHFSIISPSLKSSDTIKWYFGFGDTLRLIGKNSVDTVYTQEGQYDVTLVVNKNTPVTKANYITVHRTVKAFFRNEEYAAGNSYRFIPYDVISDPSATYFYLWSFYDSLRASTIHTDNKIVTTSDPLNAIDSFTFYSGLFKVRLKLTDIYGCSDSWEEPFTATDSIVLPNVFVPDRPEFYEIDPKDISIVLHFQVFNRYGMLVYEQEDPHILWDGRNSQGLELNTGVYYYTLNATHGDLEKKYTKKGFIHIFRSNL